MIFEPADLAGAFVVRMEPRGDERGWFARAWCEEEFRSVGVEIRAVQTNVSFNARRGTTIVMVLHDLNLSARYADHLVALHTGRVVAEGTPRQVVTEDVVRTVFGLDNRVIDDPVSHTPLVVPVGRHRPAPDAAPDSQENR